MGWLVGWMDGWTDGWIDAELQESWAPYMVGSFGHRWLVLLLSSFTVVLPVLLWLSTTLPKPNKKAKARRGRGQMDIVGGWVLVGNVGSCMRPSKDLKKPDRWTFCCPTADLHVT